MGFLPTDAPILPTGIDLEKGDKQKGDGAEAQGAKPDAQADFPPLRAFPRRAPFARDSLGIDAEVVVRVRGRVHALRHIILEGTGIEFFHGLASFRSLNFARAREYLTDTLPRVRWRARPISLAV